MLGGCWLAWAGGIGAADVPAAAAPIPLASQSEGDPYLERFDYPYPVRSFALRTQRRDLRTAYLDMAPQGQANGRTVVLLHGENFCADAWEHSIASLSRAGFRVIAPDPIGFCKSQDRRPISSLWTRWPPIPRPCWPRWPYSATC